MSLVAPLNIGLLPSLFTPCFLATICINHLMNANGSIERLRKMPQQILEI